MEASRAMPTYEYRCPNGHHFELFQKMSEEPGADCPECGSPSERLLSGGAGFVFKGEGFYATDYRSPSYKEAADQERSPAKEESTSSGKSEGKKGKSDTSSGKKTPEKGSSGDASKDGG